MYALYVNVHVPYMLMLTQISFKIPLLYYYYYYNIIIIILLLLNYYYYYYY